jgi:DNA-binding MarR family transcriptional regulator
MEMSDQGEQQPSPAARAAADDIIDLFRRLNIRMRALSSGDLTPSQASVLLRLFKGGPSSTTVLAMSEGVRSQSMTATLNSLGELGLIERRPDPEDGRRQIITLSQAGRVQAENDRDGRFAWLARSIDERFTEAQLATINEALALLAQLT